MKHLAWVVVVAALASCKGKAKDAAGSGAGSDLAAGGSAVVAAPADAAAVATVADAPAPADAAAAAGCGDGLTVDKPAVCVDVPAANRTGIEQRYEAATESTFVEVEGLTIEIGSFKGDDLAKAAKSAKAIAEAGMEDDAKLKEEDVPDGKAFAYKACEAEEGCFDSLTVVKKTTAGIVSCTATARKPAPGWLDSCRSIRAR